MLSVSNTFVTYSYRVRGMLNILVINFSNILKLFLEKIRTAYFLMRKIRGKHVISNATKALIFLDLKISCFQNMKIFYKIILDNN